MYICVCSMGGGTQTYCLWLEAAELQKIHHIVSHSWLLLGSNPTGKWIHDLCKLIVIPSKSNMQGWRFTSSQRSVFKFKCSPPHLFPIEFTLLWCHAITCHAMQPSLYRRTSHQHWRVAKLPIILYDMLFSRMPSVPACPIINCLTKFVEFALHAICGNV